MPRKNPLPKIGLTHSGPKILNTGAVKIVCWKRGCGYAIHATKPVAVTPTCPCGSSMVMVIRGGRA